MVLHDSGRSIENCGGIVVTTTEEVIQIRIRSLQREIDDMERTKAVMIMKRQGRQSIYT